MKKTLCFTILLAIMYLSSIAQSKAATFSYKKQTLQGYLEKAIFDSLKTNKSFDTLCIRSATFIKFTVSEKGEVENIFFNESSPKTFNDALRKMLLSTNGKWDTKGCKDLDTPFILPFGYDFSSKCRKKPIDYNQSLQPVYEILSYKGQKALSELKCVMLAPIFISVTADFMELAEPKRN